jgi:hypothetical protein
LARKTRKSFWILFRKGTRSHPVWLPSPACSSHRSWLIPAGSSPILEPVTCPGGGEWRGTALLCPQPGHTEGRAHVFSWIRERSRHLRVNKSRRRQGKGGDVPAGRVGDLGHHRRRRRPRGECPAFSGTDETEGNARSRGSQREGNDPSPGAGRQEVTQGARRGQRQLAAAAGSPAPWCGPRGVRGAQMSGKRPSPPSGSPAPPPRG